MDSSRPWREQEPIPHNAIPEHSFSHVSFRPRRSPRVGVSASEREKHIISNPFLQSLIERRPEDAQFNVPFVKMVSPMVRYSKLPFRVLCRRYGADLAFTPMILAKDVNRGSYVTNFPMDAGSAPHAGFLSIDEFATAPEDRPLIAQFAANDALEMAKAVEAFEPYVDGVDLNCGCPQHWVIKEGIGATLSAKPELVEDIIKQVRQRLPNDKTVSCKIRLRSNMQETLELVRRAEKAGADWITVHGRTRDEQTKAPVQRDAIALVRSAVNIPIIANGDVTTPEEMCSLVSDSGADGVLCARGALANPAIFCGQSAVPVSALTDYASIAVRYGGLFAMHQHHLSYMMYGCVSRGDRHVFTKLKSMAGVFDFMAQRNWMDYGALQPPPLGENGLCVSPHRPSSRGQRDDGSISFYEHDILSRYSSLYSPSRAPINYSYYSYPDVIPLTSPYAYELGSSAEVGGEKRQEFLDAARTFSDFHLQKDSYYVMGDLSPFSVFLRHNERESVDVDEKENAMVDQSSLVIDHDQKDISYREKKSSPKGIVAHPKSKTDSQTTSDDIFARDIYGGEYGLDLFSADFSNDVTSW